MKLQSILLSALLLSPASVIAEERVFTESFCYENVERYIPGYYDSNGYYISGRLEKSRRQVRCSGNRHSHNVPQNTHQTDRNSCIEGSILGGIAGGGLGAALSRGDGRWWAIPLGIVGGSMVGCQVDGG
jgi:uncharacterized protein YcfJ